MSLGYRAVHTARQRGGQYHWAMGFPRVTWGMSAAVWFVVLVLCCFWWGGQAITIAAVVILLPYATLVGSFTEPGRMKSERVRLHNAAFGIGAPMVLLAIGIVTLLVTGGFESGIWSVGVAGLAWFVNNAAYRAFGFGPRNDDGRLPQAAPTFKSGF